MRIKLQLIYHSSLITRMTTTIVKMSVIWSWAIVYYRRWIVRYLRPWFLFVFPPAGLSSSISKIFQSWIRLFSKDCACHKETDNNCYNKSHKLTPCSFLIFSISESTILSTNSSKSISLFQPKRACASLGFPLK